MLTLYQFPLSHFCEKARWALDYKGLEYRAVNLLPGLHVKTTRRLADRSSVPILVHDRTTIQGSGQIISHLDSSFPQHPLTPGDETARRDALEWEAFADAEIGVHVRRICYQVLLQHPETVIPMFTQDGPWYGRLLLPLIFQRLQARMREFMDINAATARSSERSLAAALDKVHSRLNGNQYLVGERFTRADLTVAALLAPLFQPRGYGLRQTKFPPEFEALGERYADRLGWPRWLYRECRERSH